MFKTTLLRIFYQKEGKCFTKFWPYNILQQQSTKILLLIFTKLHQEFSKLVTVKHFTHIIHPCITLPSPTHQTPITHPSPTQGTTIKPHGAPIKPHITPIEPHGTPIKPQITPIKTHITPIKLPMAHPSNPPWHTRHTPMAHPSNPHETPIKPP